MNILTFDIEDWFHLLDNAAAECVGTWKSRESRVERNVEFLLAALADCNARATFFCLGWVAEQHPRIITRIADAGYEVGSHSFAHRLVSHQSPTEFEEDLVRSIVILEDLVGKKVRAYRAPGLSITQATPWAFDLLIKNGIEVDCSLSRSSFSRSPEPSPKGPLWIECNFGRLKEFPVSQVRWAGINITYASSGYFRMLPYQVVRSQMRRARYSMSYFHPRDFDVAQPSLAGLSPWRQLKGRIGVHSSVEKLSRLLKDFEFMDVREALESTDWSCARSLDATMGLSEAQESRGAQ